LSNISFEKGKTFMNNKQKYDQSFMESFSIDESVLSDDLLYNSIPEWDSVGHMSLVAGLEDAFDIMFEMDDIIDFSGYKKGFEIIAKYGVVF
jgi:acyl carrier protein